MYLIITPVSVQKCDGKKTYSYACPKCNIKLYRTSRGVLLKTFLPWVPIRKYHCYKCMHKFYARKKAA